MIFNILKTKPGARLSIKISILLKTRATASTRNRRPLVSRLFCHCDVHSSKSQNQSISRNQKQVKHYTRVFREMQFCVVLYFLEGSSVNLYQITFESIVLLWYFQRINKSLNINIRYAWQLQSFGNCHFKPTIYLSLSVLNNYNFWCINVLMKLEQLIQRLMDTKMCTSFEKNNPINKPCFVLVSIRLEIIWKRLKTVSCFLFHWK